MMSIKDGRCTFLSTCNAIATFTLTDFFYDNKKSSMSYLLSFAIAQNRRRKLFRFFFFLQQLTDYCHNVLTNTISTKDLHYYYNVYCKDQHKGGVIHLVMCNLLSLPNFINISITYLYR